MTNTNGLASGIRLECIDGRDDHFFIDIPEGQTITLGNSADQPLAAITELAAGSGLLAFSNSNGTLNVDTGAANAIVKINGQAVRQGVLGANDILRIGDSIWKAHYPVAPAAANASLQQGMAGIKKRFNSLIGLEELQDFRLKDVFSNVFKKYSVQDMEEQLVTGTSKNIPQITDIDTSWARPWLFSRLLLLAAILTVLMVVGFRMFNNPNIIPGLIFIGSFAMPLATLIFFLEMNAPRNISIFVVVVLLFIGGVTSLLVALVFFRNLDFFSSFLGASAAGIIEETAKVLVVVALAGAIARYKWVLNGLLLGAAVGCGFGAFESAGYAFNVMLNAGVDAGVDNILLRGLLAPFMHIVWTANAAAALWIVKGDKKFSFAMLGDIRFLRVMISSMLLHMTWNAPFTTIPLPVIVDLKFPVLGLLAYVITFRLVQAGLKQLNEARHLETQRLLEA